MDFNEYIDRTGTFCTQWDYVEDRFGRSDLLPFTISDTDFKLPENILKLLHERVNHGVFGYSRWNHDDFKKTVKHWYKDRFDSLISLDWIAYSPSVIYSVSQLINMMSAENDGVIIQTPAYDAFFKTIRANNRVIVENPLTFDGENYTIDFDDLEIKLQNPCNKILLFCSPHNPTGRVWSVEELQRLTELCLKYDIFIISDEIHMDVVRQGVTHNPIINKVQTKVALLTSGSKTFNFPGLLFSYIIIPDKETREGFLRRLKAKDGLSSPSILGMLATMEAYKHCQNWLQALNQHIEENAQWTDDFLKKHCPKLALIPSQATYLLWIDCSALTVSMEAFQHVLINDAKVAIMDGSVYGRGGEQFLRLNVGCTRDKLMDGLHRLKIAYDIVTE